MNDDLIYQQHGSLKAAEVFDAEITGAQKAAEWAVENKELLRPERYHFCLDNTAVIYSLLGHPSDNSQEAFLTFYRMQEKLQPSQSLIHSRSLSFWCQLSCISFPSFFPVRTGIRPLCHLQGSNFGLGQEGVSCAVRCSRARGGGRSHSGFLPLLSFFLGV